MKRFLSICLSAFCLVGCSIKADRMDCPCVLKICLGGGMEEKAVFGVWNPELLFLSEIDVDSVKDVGSYQLPRGELSISAVSGVHSNILSGCRLLIANGDEMDEVFAWAGRFSIVEDSVSIHGTLHKQYALIHLTIAGDDMQLDGIPLSVHGNVEGMDLLTLSPIPGDFNTIVRPVFGRYYRICVPRQTDSGMCMDIGSIWDAFPLGAYIARTGYDWTKADLDDIEIVVDCLNARITIKILDWNDGGSFVYEI